MYIDGIEDHKDSILEKLKSIERKLELSSIGMRDDKKLAIAGRDLAHIRNDILRLRHGEITWEDLKIYNISQSQMQKASDTRREKEADMKTHLSDFNALSEVPIRQYSVNVNNSINELYSMVSFINNHYLALFTQKVLLYSTRNSGARENLYRHYQELERLFNHYVEFSDTAASRSGNRMYHDDLLHKEYISIFKKYHAFIKSLRDCIDGIQKDETLTPEDFNQTISNVDQDMRIYGLSLKVALEECKNFINEVEEYMTFINRDFFDAINLDNQKN